MVEGTKDPDDGGNPEDGPILSPDELDISDDEHVTQLDEGRFVVSPDGAPNVPDSSGGGQEVTEDSEVADPSTDETPEARPSEPAAPDPERTSERRETQGALNEQLVHDWLERELAGRQSRYSFDVTAKFDSRVSQREMASNDVVTIFESLMLWYAQQIDRDTPVEEILGILLMESNVPIRFPAGSLERLVQSADVGPDDTVADLVAAVEAQDGLKL